MVVRLDPRFDSLISDVASVIIRLHVSSETGWHRVVPFLSFAAESLRFIFSTVMAALSLIIPMHMAIPVSEIELMDFPEILRIDIMKITVQGTTDITQKQSGRLRKKKNRIRKEITMPATAEAVNKISDRESSSDESFMTCIFIMFL